MAGERDMRADYRTYNRKVVFGCAGLALLGALLLAGLVGVGLARDRQLARFPGAVEITRHENYGGLPFRYRWDNSYRTDASFTEVYNWYSTTFDLGAEARALGECILLEGAAQRLAWRRYTSVFLCNAGENRLIYVTRSTAVE